MVSASFEGLIIRRERMAKSWSQDGLCAGICAVSYLSKIEKGKAGASREILALLMQRLEIVWHGGEEAARAAELAERLYEAALSMDGRAEIALLTELDQNREAYINGPSMLDLLLLERLLDRESTDFDLAYFESAMDNRQRGVWLILSGRFEDAVRLWPTPYAHAAAGAADYAAGRYAQAQERLASAIELASEECLAFVMLHCRLLLGNCYSDLNDFDAMLRHYRAAERLAAALGDGDALKDIRYNIAATEMQFGRYEQACEYLRTVDKPQAMLLHKLAICLEKLDRKDEALNALERAASAPAEYPSREQADMMCGLVRYRLIHPGYLHDAAYGALLEECFARIRRELPNGYAAFHLPWLEEWYTANRQYKQAWELLRDFPEVHASWRNKS